MTSSEAMIFTQPNLGYFPPNRDACIPLGGCHVL